MNNDNLYLEIKTALKKEQLIVAAYIIGSVASGNINKDSDFDLVVVVKDRKTISEDKIYELVRRISFPKDLDLSVVDLNSSPLFLYQIISKGKRIYQKITAEASRFESFALHNFYDNAHLRNIYNQALKAKFSHAN
jgi:predicted nucleotidyltransferase